MGDVPRTSRGHNSVVAFVLVVAVVLDFEFVAVFAFEFLDEAVLSEVVFTFELSDVAVLELAAEAEVTEMAAVFVFVLAMEFVFEFTLVVVFVVNARFNRGIFREFGDVPRTGRGVCSLQVFSVHAVIKKLFVRCAIDGWSPAAGDAFRW